MEDEISPSQLLGESGPFAKALSGFAPRKPQQGMSDAIAVALQEASALVVEAGTGVGKTFAYLVPALLSGQRVVISTGTRHLQDQLFHRDLPLVQKTLGIGLQTALLKGRSNYLCLNRLHNSDIAIRDDVQLTKLYAIKSWANTTSEGDIAELAEIPDGDPVWAKATSTVDNCLGSDCPDFSHCHLLKARRRAQEADLVVVNHHLFFADMALKEDGFGEILPSADAFILDEAHQLPETATQFFAQSVSSRQLDDLVNDITAALLNDATDRVGIRDAASALSTRIKRFRLGFGNGQQRNAWRTMAHKQDLQTAFVDLLDTMDVLRAGLAEVLELSEALEQCANRCSGFRTRLQRFQNQEVEDWVLWFETHRNGFSLHATPPDIGKMFSEYMQAYPTAWVFTSATLSVAGKFDHFTKSLGLNGVQLKQFDSPFDYRSNALLYLPAQMPEPNSPEFLDKLIEISLPVLKASQGRAFMLFTSYRALQYVADKIESMLDYTLLVQGDAPRSQLLDRFRLSQNGVLLGTSSFWEGVDIKGEALSCVIIDKLPFAAPNDPVLQARLARIQQQGGNPFMEYQLAHAVIALKQGIGRLIRDVNDRGVLVIADPRLTTKAYGKQFLKSFPDMKMVNDVTEVQEFFS